MGKTQGNSTASHPSTLFFSLTKDGWSHNEFKTPGAETEYVLFETAELTGQEWLEAIIREQRAELAFEGDYLHDLMRLERDVLNNGKCTVSMRTNLGSPSLSGK